MKYILQCLVLWSFFCCSQSFAYFAHEDDAYFDEIDAEQGAAFALGSEDEQDVDNTDVKIEIPLSSEATESPHRLRHKRHHPHHPRQFETDLTPIG